MRERPIPLYGHEVRATLEGQKTQTRRVVNWRDVEPGLNLGFSGLQAVDQDSRGWVLTSMGGSCWEERCAPTPCPFGVPGDRLWVLETWGYRRTKWTMNDVFDLVGIEYRADGEKVDHRRNHGDRDGLPAQRPQREDEHQCDYGCYLKSYWSQWRPSIFMPRWASRLTLEVKAVRVERLQEISREDAAAEGVCWAAEQSPAPSWVTPSNWPEQNFARLWDSINYRAASDQDPIGKITSNAKRGHSWESNPWVWVVEFERVTP